ncbi:hypothetical protein EDD21DRAFT_350638 [Dissophora ornata]|nr:hypothetical protein BGZ58_005327 [Dissophora ornata]KAI8604779.1 hypothetical protein EDD21DRAFT_350638 [Dissophora ornata]
MSTRRNRTTRSQSARVSLSGSVSQVQDTIDLLSDGELVEEAAVDLPISEPSGATVDPVPARWDPLAAQPGGVPAIPLPVLRFAPSVDQQRQSRVRIEEGIRTGETFLRGLHDYSWEWQSTMVQAIIRSEACITEVSDAPSRKRVAEDLAETLRVGETTCYNTEVQIRSMLDRLKRLKQHDRVLPIFYEEDELAFVKYPLTRAPLADGSHSE